MHLPALISDLGVILITAAMVSLLFKKLKQPVVLGYLLAGFLVGPNWPWFPTVTDVESIKVWAEIGVIFLLFGLGLEFNFKKLTQVGKASTVIAAFEVVFMLAAGFLTGRALGWHNNDSLFLGGMLAISSTTIIVRSFDELGVKAKKYVNIVFGVLVVEDLFAIVIMALLATYSLSKGFSGADFLLSIGKLIFFLVLWFALGVYFLPSFFKRIHNYLNSETLLVISVGLCLLMVILVTKVDFSPALGAFLMGSLLSETKSGEQIEKLLHPIKDLFGAIFFVSIGMLINPQLLTEYVGPILIITLVTIVGKLISSTLGAIIAGTDAKSSIKVGFSLAQIGEFSFIIATLGVTLKVTSDFLYPIAVSVSAITTFLTPYLIKSSEKSYEYIEKKLPRFVWDYLEKYRAAINTESAQSGFVEILWKAYGWSTLLSTVFILALFHGARHLKTFLLAKESFSYDSVIFGILITTTALAAPFFGALALKKPSSRLQADEIARLKNLALGINIVRFFTSFALAIYAFKLIIPIYSFPIFIIGIILVLLITLSFFSATIFKKIEKRFVENLSQNHKAAEKPTPVLSPWEGGLYDFTIHPNSNLVGRTLEEMAFRARFNSTVVLIERGEIQYFAPKRNWILMPFDKLKILSTDDQIEKLIKEYESSLVSQLQEQNEESKANFGLHSFTIDKESPLAENKIKDTKIREKVEGIIVGVERNEQRIINPDPEFTLQALDRVWMVGNLKKMENVKTLSWIICAFLFLSSTAAWTAPSAKVDCHFFYSGEEKIIRVPDDKTLYEAPTEKLGYFFKTKISWSNEKKSSIKVYTYAYTEPRLKLIHLAEFDLDKNKEFGFTGKHFLYEHTTEAEVFYWCERK